MDEELKEVRINFVNKEDTTIHSVKYTKVSNRLLYMYDKDEVIICTAVLSNITHWKVMKDLGYED